MYDDDSIFCDVGCFFYLGFLVGDSYIEFSFCCFVFVGWMVMVEDLSYLGLLICLVDRLRRLCIMVDVDF